MNMFTSLVLTSAFLFAGAAHAGDAAVERPIRQMMEGFNKGDIKLVKALHVTSPTIIDETHPFVWSGPKAFDTWVTQLTKNEAQEGKTDGVVWFGDPVRESVVGDNAYVVAPCTYSFKQNGQAMRETGTITFALIKKRNDWKIASWAWSSPEAQPVK
jgi:hypothetical protein